MLMLADEVDPDRTRLLMADFDGRALSYASPAHRFATRLEQLQHNLALLVAYGLVARPSTGACCMRSPPTS